MKLPALAIALLLTACPLAQPAFPDAAVAGSVVKIVLASGGHGSGVHIGKGYILTAAHVVEGEKAVTVIADDGAVYTHGTTEIMWANGAYDVALLRFRGETNLGTSPLSCSEMAVGEEIEGIGNPFDLEFIHTWGKISSKPKTHGPWASAYVVDMTIGPGMSGGAMLNKQREVVGILVGGIFSRMGSFPFSYVVPSTAACTLLAK